MSDTGERGDPVAPIIEKLRAFVAAREWEQFHDPKNLAMAIASEAGELLAEYRWVRSSESDAYARDESNLLRVSNEAADVAIALLLFCDRVGVRLGDAIDRKLAINEVNYPVAESRGMSRRPSNVHPRVDSR